MRHLIALTNDPALQKALEELAGSDAAASIVVVGDMRGLTDELMQQSSATALIDAGSIDMPVEGAVDAITMQFPDLRLLVAGHSVEQNQLSSRIADQRVFRFVHKPVSPQRLRLFLDAASRTDTLVPAPVAAPAPARIASRRDPSPRGTSTKLPVIVGIAVLVVAAGVWAFWPRGSASVPATTATGNAAATADRISRAIQAFTAGRYVASDGTSAAELYRQALQLDQRNAVAEAGYTSAIDHALRNAEEALLAGRLDEAGALAESLRLLAPGNSRLEFLYAQLTREQTRVNADLSQRQAFEARQVLIRGALDRMAERIRSGAMLDPVTNSAVSHFREAEAAGAGDAAVRGAREALVAAMLTAVDNELGAGRAAPARRLLDAAAAINSSAPGLDVLRRRLDAAGAPPAPAPAPAPTVSLVVPARTETPPPAPVATPPSAAPAATAPAEPAADVPVAASSLQVLRKQPVEYPERALLQLISGWVDLEYTVTRDGTVKDVVVVQSEPGRTFDAAATKALLRYRYAPVLRNGEPVQQRARIRMRFTASDAK